jgi:hypothetical protein
MRASEGHRRKPVGTAIDKSGSLPRNLSPDFICFHLVPIPRRQIYEFSIFSNIPIWTRNTLSPREKHPKFFL